VNLFDVSEIERKGDPARKQMRRLLAEWARTEERCARLQQDMRDLESLCARLELGKAGDITDAVETRRMSVARADALRAIYQKEADRLQYEIGEAIALKRAIDGLLKGLSPTARQVIEMRYINQSTPVYIGMKMNYSDRQIQRIECDAVTKLAERLQYSRERKENECR